MEEQFWMFSCGNAFYNGRMFRVSAYSQNEAEQIAADHEAVLRRITFVNGHRSKCETIYDPNKF